MDSKSSSPAAPHSQVIKLCGTEGCCPEIEKKPDGTFELRDDFGGKVILTQSQLDDLKQVNFAKE